MPRNVVDLEAGEIITVLGPNVVPAVGKAIHGLRPPARPGALVVGVELGGEARAYPLNVLAFHQVVNDSMAGHPVAVTYDPLCRSAMVFERPAARGTLTLRVSGKLLRNNLLMFDDGTGSLWSQLWARAIQGPLGGQGLGVLPVDVLPWEAWRSAHPSSLFLQPPNPHVDYGPDFDPTYSASGSTLFPRRNRDERMHPKELVAGLVVGGLARAYPVALVPDGGRTVDYVGGTAVEVHREGVNVRAKVGSERLPLTLAHWFAWSDFYPGTGVWSPHA